MIITQRKAVVSATAQSNTRRKYHKNIIADSLKGVKKLTRRILHSQEITTPDGVELHITLTDATVNFTDPKGGKVKFSAHLVPEVLGTLLDVEKKFWGGLSSGKV